MYAIIDSHVVVTNSMIALNAFLFFALVGLYFAAVKLFVYRYKKKYNRRPVFNGMFRLYSQNLISNAPSKKERAFYIATNKLKVVFNSLLVATVFTFVILCFANQGS